MDEGDFFVLVLLFIIICLFASCAYDKHYERKYIEKIEQMYGSDAAEIAFYEYRLGINQKKHVHMTPIVCRRG